MSGYVLTPTARQALVEVSDYYLEAAGHQIAQKMLNEFTEAFEFLGRTPGAGHKREDLMEDLPVKVWPMRDYLIIYKPETSPVEIITVIRGSRDIPTIVRHGV